MSIAELFAMGEARLEWSWRQASFIGALAFNSNPYLKRTIDPNDIYPFKKKTRKKVRLEEIADLL